MELGLDKSSEALVFYFRDWVITGDHHYRYMVNNSYRMVNNSFSISVKT